MATDSMPPPPGSGGNLKYGIIGVVLIGGAAALYFGMRGCEEQPTEVVQAPVEVDAGNVERSSALADDDLLIPEVEPDSGPPPDAGVRVRYVTRYVGGGGGARWGNCTGDIDQSAARAALSRYSLQFRNCYERRLKVNNTLEGRLEVRMRVGSSGSVTGVQTRGSMRDSEVLSCVRRIANRAQFPAPTQGRCAVVAAPFNFTPRP